MITNISKSLTKTDYSYYLSKGISYEEYKAKMNEELVTTSDSKLKEYISLNQHRMKRIEKVYKVSENVKSHLSKLHHRVYWLIISEHWCGDAAQNLPVINKIAELSKGMIELKIVYRDQNNDLMDAHLSNGSRSIPKLIQLDTNFNITGLWGPRPSVAQTLVKSLKSDPKTATSYSIELHKWYATDRNESLEMDMVKLINRANIFCQDCLN